MSSVSVLPVMISIHAPRTGSDSTRQSRGKRTINFNPRSPHGERRDVADAGDGGGYFNPRSPHGERQSRCTTPAGRLYFNPRSPHGERRSIENVAEKGNSISIHAPRTGSDGAAQSCVPQRKISIHAPRTGSDRKLRDRGCFRFDFNPRSPHGERH